MSRPLIRMVFTADERLDDVTRARIWSRLHERLAKPEAPPSRRPYAIAGAVLAVAAAVALVVGLRRGRDAEITLTAPADSVVTTRLGPYAPATIVGPATLAVDGGDETRIRLTAGAIYAEFEGGPGRSLRIDAPGAVITVVGTRFAVEATESGTCVSVSHGRVRVDADGSTRFVDSDQRWCTGDAHAPAAIDAGTRATIERFTTAQRAPVTAGVPVPASPSVPEHVASDPPRHDPAPAERPAPVAHPAPEHRAPTERPGPARHDPSTAPPSPLQLATPAGWDTAPTPPPAPAPRAPDAPAPLTAEQRYEAAERALARGDANTADRILAELVASDPTSSLAAEALFERARLAFERHAWGDARSHLDALAARHEAALAEPAHYLRCRIAVASHDHDAATCLHDYRATYTSGPHDADVLGLLAQVAADRGGCDNARGAIADLARAHPDAKITRAWLARCPEAK
jgi:hypothetical protein